MHLNKSTISKMGNKSLGQTNLAKLKDFVEATGGSLAIEITTADGSTIHI
ncbi:hypothetical protein [Paraferrimonas sp. SM1919]|nr:hypothetical protein [Paraferrimonas sp. SM1919]